MHTQLHANCWLSWLPPRLADQTKATLWKYSYCTYKPLLFYRWLPAPKKFTELKKLIYMKCKQLQNSYLLYIWHGNLTNLTKAISCCPPLLLIFGHHCQHFTLLKRQIILILYMQYKGTSQSLRIIINKNTRRNFSSVKVFLYPGDEVSKFLQNNGIHPSHYKAS